MPIRNISLGVSWGRDAEALRSGRAVGAGQTGDRASSRTTFPEGNPRGLSFRESVLSKCESNGSERLARRKSSNGIESSHASYSSSFISASRNPAIGTSRSDAPCSLS